MGTLKEGYGGEEKIPWGGGEKKPEFALQKRGLQQGDERSVMFSLSTGKKRTCPNDLNRRG